MIDIIAEGTKFEGFIQTSDIHIGECRSLEGYIARHKDVLSQVLDSAEESKLLLVPGDLFHRKDTRYDEYMLAKWFILECERRKIYLILTAGNHDHLEGKKTQLDKLELDPASINDTLGALLKYQDDIAKIQGSEAAQILQDVNNALKEVAA